MATNSYFQVPPDSTGKRVFTQEHTVNAQPVQVQVMHVADKTNSANIQAVDPRGQANVRFAEGSPTMDAFGNLRVGEGKVLGAYDYTNSDMADLFTDVGTVTWSQNSSETLLTVDQNNASLSSRTTNRYHYYQPGVSNLAIITLAHGDTGKVGNTRRWGYYDTEDGIFFELVGTTLNVVIRSSVGGSIVENRVPQSAFNQDKLDGTGVSSMNIDVTKANFYFMDYAWLGVGEVRLGVLGPNGERNICHIFQNPNANTHAYMRTGSLPLRWELFNTALAGSSSTMRLICAAVYAQSRTDYTFWRFADIESASNTTVTTNTPIVSMKVKPGSRIGIYPECLCVYVVGGNVKLTILDDAVLTGATWGISGEGDALGDNAATAVTGGSKFKTFYVGPGVTNLPIAQFYETNDEGYHRLADDSDSYTFTLVATKLDGTTVTAYSTLEYRELR